MSIRFGIFACAIGAIATFSSAAQASSLLQNGDFSSGLTDWTNVGNPSSWAVVADPTAPGGTSDYASNGTFTTATLSQTFSDIAGTGYQLSFYFEDQVTAVDAFTAQVGSTAGVSIPNGTSWAQYIINFTGSGHDTVVFSSQVIEATNDLADVSVTPVGAAAVPEPSTIWLMASGLLAMLGIGFAVRRRRVA